MQVEKDKMRRRQTKVWLLQDHEFRMHLPSATSNEEGPVHGSSHQCYQKARVQD